MLTVPVLSHAAIIETTGAVEQIAVPPSVTIGSLQSNDKIFAFQERSLMRLSQDVLVDVTQPGVVIYSSDLTHGTIPRNTVVDVYYLHFDPVDYTTPHQSAFGSITFDRDVAGIILGANNLVATDSLLGAPGTAYDLTNGVNLTPQDAVVLMTDRRTVIVDFNAGGGRDPLRIITVLPPVEGDIDGDGFVGVVDLNIVLSKWNLDVGPDDPSGADPTGDGFVGVADLNMILGNWNAGIPPAVTVPEPASILWAPLLALWRSRRGRK
jgi:hypothetical protein